MKKNHQAFTLLEIILAITILTLAVGGSFALISQTVGSISIIRSKLIASYLAQEGIEIVKNIRDSNWLKEIAWDEGLPDSSGCQGDCCGGVCEADYTSQSLTRSYGSYLYIGNNGFYSYGSGSQTKFKRKITISNKEDLDDPPDGEIDRLKVGVEVEWTERGRTYQVRAQEYLYDWKPKAGQ